MSDKMDAYLLYVGDQYYPSRAVGDLVGRYESVEDCKAAAKKHGGDWAAIVRHSDMTVVVEAGIADEGRWRFVDDQNPAKWEWER